MRSRQRSSTRTRTRVPMSMMNVRAVRVIVLDPVMSMGVGVFADEGGIVDMVVVSVVVPVGVLVLERLVGMPVSVALGEVQVDAKPEQRRRHGGERARAVSTETPRQSRPHERRQRKD